ncbi:ATP phosphoribosyltransferase regulatory subunit, partial [Inquilinus sp.]|uniref:ATP phosphoribosyltransferase regulatory subunit n=1 Tax=Inquilinus sp. TaxID=1932117 RepID=UPI0031DC82A1
MTDAPNTALLPEGFYDVLPPDAAQEAAVIERMMAVLGGHGFDRVKPPLVEFEDTLLSGVGASMARHTFRLMDPMGSRMLGLRAGCGAKGVSESMGGRMNAGGDTIVRHARGVQRRPHSPR